MPNLFQWQASVRKPDRHLRPRLLSVVFHVAFRNHVVPILLELVVRYARIYVTASSEPSSTGAILAGTRIVASEPARANDDRDLRYAE